MYGWTILTPSSNGKTKITKPLWRKLDHIFRKSKISWSKLCQLFRTVQRQREDKLKPWLNYPLDRPSKLLAAVKVMHAQLKPQSRMNGAMRIAARMYSMRNTVTMNGYVKINTAVRLAKPRLGQPVFGVEIQHGSLNALPTTISTHSSSMVAPTTHSLLASEIHKLSQ